MAGRKQENPIRQFFTYNKEKDESKCNLCGFVMKGNHAKNLERHIQRKHEDEYKKFMSKKESEKRNRDEPRVGGEPVTKKLRQEKLTKVIQIVMDLAVLNNA